MSLVDLDFSGLAQQAPTTVVGYARRIISEMDGHFGEGYMKRNPALLGEMVKAAAIDFATATAAKMIEHGCNRIADMIQLCDARTVEARADKLAALRQRHAHRV